MSFEVSGARALADVPCRYGTSRLLVRGPRRSLQNPYIAFLGSSDTYGGFVVKPFASLVEDDIGMTCVNLGCANAGVDALLHDAEILRIAIEASQVVLQIGGAQNMSNTLYRVHPRRNDRFLKASPMLRAIYPEVDFTDFHFIKHMLVTLHNLSPSRFRPVRDEIQKTWLARMRLLLKKLGSQTLLLWLHRQALDQSSSGLGPDPLLVTRAMLEELAEQSAGLVEVPVAAAAESGDMEGLLFGPLQAPIAEQSLGPRAHADAANRLLAQLRPCL